MFSREYCSILLRIDIAKYICNCLINFADINFVNYVSTQLFVATYPHCYVVAMCIILVSVH